MYPNEEKGETVRRVKEAKKAKKKEEIGAGEVQVRVISPYITVSGSRLNLETRYSITG